MSTAMQQSHPVCDWVDCELETFAPAHSDSAFFVGFLKRFAAKLVNAFMPCVDNANTLSHKLDEVMQTSIKELKDDVQATKTRVDTLAEKMVDLEKKQRENMRVMDNQFGLAMRAAKGEADKVLRYMKRYNVALKIPKNVQPPRDEQEVARLLRIDNADVLEFEHIPMKPRRDGTHHDHQLFIIRLRTVGLQARVLRSKGDIEKRHHIRVVKDTTPFQRECYFELNQAEELLKQANLRYSRGAPHFILLDNGSTAPVRFNTLEAVKKFLVDTGRTASPARGPAPSQAPSGTQPQPGTQGSSDHMAGPPRGNHSPHPRASQVSYGGRGTGGRGTGGRGSGGGRGGRGGPAPAASSSFGLPPPPPGNPPSYAQVTTQPPRAQAPTTEGTRPRSQRTAAQKPPGHYADTQRKKDNARARPSSPPTETPTGAHAIQKQKLNHQPEMDHDVPPAFSPGFVPGLAPAWVGPLTPQSTEIQAGSASRAPPDPAQIPDPGFGAAQQDMGEEAELELRLEDIGSEYGEGGGSGEENSDDRYERMMNPSEADLFHGSS